MSGEPRAPGGRERRRGPLFPVVGPIAVPGMRLG